MSLTVSDDRIMYLAEQEIKDYVSGILNQFQSERMCQSDKFDPRMQEIVEKTVRAFILYNMPKTITKMVEEAVAKITPERLALLIVDEFKAQIDRGRSND